VKAHGGIRALPIAVLLLLASLARGETVSYTANLPTSKGKPVYDILILASDGIQVHATVYPSTLPGMGISVISHNVPFTPVKSLIIGLTAGQDAAGNDHTQIIMFLDSGFAAAHAGEQFSSVFTGTRHSTTVANLQAAVAGDAAQLAWFTDTFFSGPAAGAAFDPRGSFTVAEFTSLTITGASAVAGNWLVTSAQTIPFSDPQALNGRATEMLGETAQVDTGPFDIAFVLDLTSDRGQLAIDKTVLNSTGVPWQTFEMQLGTGSGASFVPSTTGDGLSFVSTLTNQETTGAFPNVVVEEDRIVFSGFLAPGATAHFVVFVGSATAENFTLRQLAVGRPSAGVSAPTMSRWSLALLAILLAGISARRLGCVRHASPEGGRKLG